MGSKSSISVHPRMIPSQPLATKVVALEWLKAQPQYADSVVASRSGYRDKVEGGVEGDDTLGYDIEVATKSRRFKFEVKGTAEDGKFELTDTRRRLSCHISRIGVAGTWVPNCAVARYGPLEGLALRCCSRSTRPDAPVAEIAM